MKIFKKVIKKVPLPLMFVTFVLAVLMLAAGPLSAAPNCDSDGDTFIKDSKYCRNKYEGPYDCDDSTHSDTNDCSGGSGGNTAPDPYNLARASFATRAELGNPPGGVFADGVDTCSNSEGLYDYWDWQEALLPANVGLDCSTYLNRSNVSGGGRWFLISATGNEDPTDRIERWLVVDFTDYTDSKLLSPCYDLDINIYNPDQLVSYNEGTGYDDARNADLCVDHLAIRLPADRILKANASEQQLEISFRHRPDPEASIYWPPWGYVSYEQPLYLRSLSTGDPSHWQGCRVMSTRSAPGEPHDRAKAQLLREIGPGTTEPMGTYNLPLEVCVKRASD